LQLYLSDGYPTEWRWDRAALAPPSHRFDELLVKSAEQFERFVAPWLSEFTWPLGRIYNGAFQAVDAEVYYSVIRTLRPQRIIEVGAGHSTAFALEALHRNGRGEVTCIDPSPLYALPKGAHHVRSRIEDVDLALFDSLCGGDILFIDSSHTSEEAHYHVEKILPRLASGVLIEHHDFLYPYASPWGERGMDEQGVLLDFYSRHSDDFEILMGNAFLVKDQLRLVRQLVHAYRWVPVLIPGSLWARRR